MAENKTKATDASVDAYIDAIDDQERRGDCRTLVKLMTAATKQQPRMWGAGIVGFGSYHYKYDSKREGDWCAIGFASRKGDMSLYLMCDSPGTNELLGRLGRHKMGKACLYIRRLSDVNLEILEQLIAGSVASVAERFGSIGA